MFVESSEFKNRITAAINDLQIEPVTVSCDIKTFSD